MADSVCGWNLSICLSSIFQKQKARSCPVKRFIGWAAADIKHELLKNEPGVQRWIERRGGESLRGNYFVPHCTAHSFYPQLCQEEQYLLLPTALIDSFVKWKETILHLLDKCFLLCTFNDKSGAVFRLKLCIFNHGGLIKTCFLDALACEMPFQHVLADL